MDDDRKIYEEFIDWLRTSWGHLPDSVELMPLIMATFSPEEADLLTGVPFSPCDIKELASLKHKDSEELARIFDALAGKGLVFRVERAGTTQYRLNDARFVYLRSFFWPGRDDEYTRAVAPKVNRYYRDGFGDNWKHVQTKGLRAVPLNRSIKDPRSIRPYEDVLAVLQEQDRFAVATCSCRHRKNLDPTQPSCSHEIENCLHFGRLADYIIENRLGSEIDRGQAEEILTKAADAGLVHAVSNWQRGIDTICNCCRCCCVYFEAFHVLKHARCMNTSNFWAQTNQETCSGCGLCVKRCPMGALRLVESSTATNKTGKVAQLEPDLCIGCGVCVYKCPTESLSLEQRNHVKDPPIDVTEHRKVFLAEREAACSRNKP